MFRASSDEAYEAGSESGVRHLFELGPYTFQDTLDGEDAHHHFIVEQDAEGARSAYEVDRDTMYEFMARFLAGAYELEEYELEHSPTHDELLDVLEIATARARSGESGFSWDEFDPAETEILDEDADEEAEGEGEGGR